MWVSMREIFALARPGKFALAAFHASNLEQVQAVMGASLETKSPAIIAFDESAAIYAGLAPFLAMSRELALEFPSPVAVQLDHVHDLDLIETGVARGVSGVVYDPRDDQGDEGRERMKSVRRMCESAGAWFEIEVRGSEGASGRTAEEMVRLARAVRPDGVCLALRPSEREKPGGELFSLAELLRCEAGALVSVAGAGSWPEAAVQRAVAAGVWKISVGSRLNQAFTDGLRGYLESFPERILPRSYLGAARDSARLAAAECIRAFGSADSY